MVEYCKKHLTINHLATAVCYFPHISHNSATWKLLPFGFRRLHLLPLMAMRLPTPQEGPELFALVAATPTLRKSKLKRCKWGHPKVDQDARRLAAMSTCRAWSQRPGGMHPVRS